jgi:mRNA interferase RelE/StbE
MKKVVVHRRAAKYLQKLPKEQKDQIKKVLKRLEDNPLDMPGIRHMVGEWAGYSRIRLGNLRVIFWFDESESTIYIDHIGPRGDIYK